MKPNASAATLPGLDLDRFLPYRLSLLSNRISAAIAAGYQAQFGLSISEWRTMAVLGRFGPLTATEVGQRTAMDKVRVSRAIAGLIAQGRVARRIDAEDRRRRVLSLTLQGRADHDRIVPLAQDTERRLLAALTSADRADLDRLLQRLEASVAALEPDAISG